MFDDDPPFGWRYLLRKQEAFQKGQDDARFGTIPRSIVPTIFSLDYNDGYEKMKKLGDTMRAEEERQRQLTKTIDAIKTHKPLF